MEAYGAYPERQGGGTHHHAISPTLPAPLGAKPPISPNRPSLARSPIGREDADGRASEDRAFAAPAPAPAADLAIILAVGERSARGERLAVISVVVVVTRGGRTLHRIRATCSLR